MRNAAWRASQSNQIQAQVAASGASSELQVRPTWTTLVLSQNGLCKMLTDNVYVLDETSDAKPAPIIHLDASHRKPKDYHDFFFTGFSKAVKTKSGVQGRHEIKVHCKLWITSNSSNGKKVKATDSYTNLTQNYASESSLTLMMMKLTSDEIKVSLMCFSSLKTVGFWKTVEI